MSRSTPQGGFHGRSIGAMALTTSKVIYKQHFGPFMPGVHIAPYPYCLHCKVQAEKVRRAAAAAAEAYIRCSLQAPKCMCQSRRMYGTAPGIACTWRILCSRIAAACS